uniref:Apple domain-containing protein n=1 Tax=Tetraselmis sp. GSL018 TaxID=582737 RepID=A0A061R2N1_9CHLO
MFAFIFALVGFQLAGLVLGAEDLWIPVKRHWAIKPVGSWNWQRRYYDIEDCFENCKLSNGFAFIVHNRDSGRCYCWPPAPYPGDLSVYSKDEDTYSLKPTDISASDLTLYYGCGSYYSLLQACSETCGSKWIAERVDELMPDNCNTPDYWPSLRTSPGTCQTKLAIEFQFDCEGYGDGYICCCEGAGSDCD